MEHNYSLSFAVSVPKKRKSKKAKRVWRMKKHQTRISIGVEIERWRDLRNKLGLKNDEDLACVLMDNMSDENLSAWKRKIRLWKSKRVHPPQTSPKSDLSQSSQDHQSTDEEKDVPKICYEVNPPWQTVRDEWAQTEIKSEDQLDLGVCNGFVAPAVENEDIVPQISTSLIKNEIKEESVATKLQSENRLEVSMDSSDKISHSFVQTANPVTVERKVVVCKQRPQVPKETHFTGLFKTCIQCGKPVLEYTTVSSGNLNRLQWKCANGHLMWLFPNTNPT